MHVLSSYNCVLKVVKYTDMLCYVIRQALSSPDTLRTAAYEHVRWLIDAIPSPDEVASETDREQPPAKQRDSCNALLRFLATTSTTSATPMHEFDRYLAAADAEDSEALQWWSQHANSYPLTAHIARQYLSLPATSAQSERQLSAAR